MPNAWTPPVRWMQRRRTVGAAVSAEPNSTGARERWRLATVSAAARQQSRALLAGGASASKPPPTVAPWSVPNGPRSGSRERHGVQPAHETRRPTKGNVGRVCTHADLRAQPRYSDQAPSTHRQCVIHASDGERSDWASRWSANTVRTDAIDGKRVLVRCEPGRGGVAVLELAGAGARRAPGARRSRSSASRRGRCAHQVTLLQSGRGPRPAPRSGSSPGARCTGHTPSDTTTRSVRIRSRRLTETAGRSDSPRSSRRTR